MFGGCLRLVISLLGLPCSQLSQWSRSFCAGSLQAAGLLVLQPGWWRRLTALREGGAHPHATGRGRWMGVATGAPITRRTLVRPALQDAPGWPARLPASRQAGRGIGGVGRPTGVSGVPFGRMGARVWGCLPTSVCGCVGCSWQPWLMYSGFCLNLQPLSVFQRKIRVENALFI